MDAHLKKNGRKTKWGVLLFCWDLMLLFVTLFLIIALDIM
jgi:hypothetical protein